MSFTDTISQQTPNRCLATEGEKEKAVGVISWQMLPILI